MHPADLADQIGADIINQRDMEREFPAENFLDNILDLARRFAEEQLGDADAQHHIMVEDHREAMDKFRDATIEQVATLEHALKGGYVVHEVQGEDLTFVSTGSEVSIVLEAAQKLEAQGLKVRVVSLPCWNIFDSQPEEYKLSVLRSGAPILSVEAYNVSCYLKAHCTCTDPLPL